MSAAISCRTVWLSVTSWTRLARFTSVLLHHEPTFFSNMTASRSTQIRIKKKKKGGGRRGKISDVQIGLLTEQPYKACIWKHLYIFYVFGQLSSWVFLRTRASFCPVICLYIGLFGIPDDDPQKTIQSRCGLTCLGFWDHVPTEPFVLSLLKLISADETSQNTS